MGPRAAIVVSSFDLFHDCWIPFFAIFRRFWPECPFPAFLITNHLRVDDGPYKAIQVGDDPGWGGALTKVLASLDYEYFFYFQDDHFLMGKVDHEQVNRDFEFLTNSEYEMLSYRAVREMAEDDTRVSENYLAPSVEGRNGFHLDPSLWRKERFQELLRPEENAWQFLSNGKKRVVEMKLKRIQWDRARFDACPIHYFRRSGVRLSLWKLDALLWMIRNRVPIWPLRRGVCMRSFELHRLAKKNKGNRWIQFQASGYGVGGWLTDLQRKRAVARMKRICAKEPEAVIPINAEAERYAARFQ